ncbi:MAG: 4'-phosphopantetheinyl transferase superfamily protein [Bacillota bacterium]
MVIYYCKICDLCDETLISKYESTASPERQKKIKAQRFVQDKARSLGAELLLRYCLQTYGVDEKNIFFGYNEHKKPYLKGDSMPYFNLSHSGDFVVVALSTTEAVGVDIEEMKIFREGVAKKVFTETELAHIESQGDQNTAMYQQWSLKESVTKAIGTGFSLSPQSFSVEVWNGGIISPKINDLSCFCQTYTLPDLPYALSACATANVLPTAPQEIELSCIFSFFSHK